MAIFSRKLTTDELAFGLTRLSATENMDVSKGRTSTSSDDITIAADTEITLSNPFTARGIIPEGYWIYKQKGNGLITAGDTDWTNTTLTLKNHGTASVTFRILFFARI